MDEKAVAVVSDNITPTIIKFFSSPGSPENLVVEDKLTPLINELSEVIVNMMLSVITRDRQRTVIHLGNVLKQPISLSTPTYYKRDG